MLGRRHIAEEIGAGAGRNGPADRADDVVVARGDVRRQRSQNVIGRVVAEALLKPHVGGDPVQRDMARSLHHDLYPRLPGAVHQFPEHDQFGELRAVFRIADGSRPQPVAQRQGHIVQAGDREQAVEMFVERIFAPVQAHPFRHQASAAGNHSHDPVALLEDGQGSGCDAAMEGHEINAHLRFVFDVRKEGVLGEIPAGEAAGKQAADGAIDGHRADHHGGVFDHPGKDGVDIASRGEVHHGVRPGFDGRAQFFDLLREVGVACRCPDVGVDFGREPLADRPGFEGAQTVFRDYDGACRQFPADLLRRHAVMFRRLFHFQRYFPCFSRIQLCHFLPSFQNA